MQNKKTHVIGVMSGTSLDGLDIAYVAFEEDYKKFEILKAETFSYTAQWKKLLKEAILQSKEKLKELDLEYGCYIGEKVKEFITNNKIEEIDLIASHGHTVFHQPEKGITLQIGDGQSIANVTNHKVICDFRTQDVELGGQGAPLVPIGDQLLFEEYNSCVNLGGFANISYQEKNKRIAFDICPVNIVLNNYTRKIGYDFDKNGEIARGGTLNAELLKALNSLSYYNSKPPKSLGLEWVTAEVFPLINDLETEIPTILRTFVKHSAFQIGRIIREKGPVLVTGGGVYNTFLMEEIEKEVGFNIVKESGELIEFKEALIFAFLGLLRDKDKINCLQSVTGAIKDHSSGKIYTSKK
ncbi:anhydro-N-acetylmuramic acid kinase [Tenacibaculum amylolyticum]|uniref:anhydro-N-acetylmuramic acid kinase n=1 Tax=Tenacibaculum amylolyticum TaxID=104269 RepID=UPI003894210A